MNFDNQKIICYLESKDAQIVGVAEKSGIVELNNKEIYNYIGKNVEYGFRINLSKNVSTLFIETQSGTMQNLEKDKNYREKGNIYSVDKDGKSEYAGTLEISGRGNGTWNQGKKPYNLYLTKSGTLAGLSDSTNWVLLSMWYEGDKIHSKIAYDLERIFEGAYPSDCTWVDVYFNGNYNGMYLLIQSIKGREAFQFEEDGFLLEKDMTSRLENDYFITNHGGQFVLKKSAKSNLNEVRKKVQQYKDTIYNKQLCEEVIDTESFEIQFLINKIAYNFDSFRTSAYFYKLDKDDKLYAGPCWDYDGAFGEYLHYGDAWVNLGGTIFNGEERLEWFEELYRNPQFVKGVVSTFEEHHKEIYDLIDIGIDEYAEYIKVAVENDELRWKFSSQKISKAGTYLSWDNNVRYLKWFLCKRLNILKDTWGSRIEPLEWKSNGEVHIVEFLIGGEVIETFYVPDGEIIYNLPDARGADWCFEYSGEEYNVFLPILEDCRFVTG